MTQSEYQGIQEQIESSSRSLSATIPSPKDLHVLPEDLTDRARVHHTAEWRVKFVMGQMTPLEREMFAEWLRVASQVAQEKLLADGIKRVQDFMAVDPHALEPVRLSPSAKPKPVKSEPHAADILGI